MRWLGLGLGLCLFVSGCQVKDAVEVCKIERFPWEYESLDIDPQEWHDLYRFEGGVIYVNYQEQGWRPNPVTSAQYALASYNYFLKTADEKYHAAFLEQVKYLTSIAMLEGEAAHWSFDFDYPPYGLKAGWLSGLAQAQVLSVLARSYEEAPSPELKRLMRQAINPMMKNRMEGGLLVTTPEGGLWVEEYPSEQPSLVLNGFVFAVLGLGDYLRVVPEDTEVEEFYKRLLSSLKLSLDKYELDGWLGYDRSSLTPVSERYMYVQTRQMSQLFRQTNDDFYSRRCSEWSGYERE